jgi:hypothetical protein
MSKEFKKTIAFDFDGVIHQYRKGWQNGEIYDCIIDGWVDSVREFHNKGYNVIILTTRSKRQVYKFLWEKYHSYEAMKPEPAKTDDFFSSGFAFRVMPFYEKFFNAKRDHKDYKGKTVGICNHKAVFHVLIDDRTIRRGNRRCK